jgi:hypothetical protein
LDEYPVMDEILTKELNIVVKGVYGKKATFALNTAVDGISQDCGRLFQPMYLLCHPADPR